MPKLIEYSAVLERLQSQGLKSLYHNSGAFWFCDGVETISRGWVGPDDESISPLGRALVRQVAEPFAESLSALFLKYWLEHSSGVLWIMPKSHWAYELQFGSREWLPEVLKRIGIDFNPLAMLNNAAAIAFDTAESKAAGLLVLELLRRLAGSDFQAVFADTRTICTIHSRTQLWWTTVDKPTVAALDLLLPLNANADARNIEGGEPAADR